MASTSQASAPGFIAAIWRSCIATSSRAISKEEAEFVYEDGCKRLVLGTGQDDNVRLSKEASEYFERKGCKVIAQPTPDAIDTFNHSTKKKIGVFHVTC